MVDAAVAAEDDDAADAAAVVFGAADAGASVGEEDGAAADAANFDAAATTASRNRVEVTHRQWTAQHARSRDSVLAARPLAMASDGWVITREEYNPYRWSRARTDCLRSPTNLPRNSTPRRRLP